MEGHGPADLADLLGCERRLAVVHEIGEIRAPDERVRDHVLQDHRGTIRGAHDEPRGRLDRHDHAGGDGAPDVVHHAMRRFHRQLAQLAGQVEVALEGSLSPAAPARDADSIRDRRDEAVRQVERDSVVGERLHAPHDVVELVLDGTHRLRLAGVHEAPPEGVALEVAGLAHVPVGLLANDVLRVDDDGEHCLLGGALRWNDERVRAVQVGLGGLRHAREKRVGERLPLALLLRRDLLRLHHSSLDSSSLLDFFAFVASASRTER